ncbi:MAG: PAS domain-containing protein [Deltaproteobacteria bacterium]|nr:PAS domain-containing protein [Deltaproteobacteria bacterium]
MKELKSDLYEVFFNASNDLMLFLSKEGVVLECNKAFLSMFNLKKEDVIGKRCFEVVHKTGFHVEGCPLLKAQGSRKREEMEMIVGDRVFRVTVDPILDNEGNIEGFAHLATDITNYKSLIKSLEDSESKFRELFNASKDGQIIMREIFLDTNDRMAEIFKCNKSDIIGKRPADFSPLYQPDGSSSFEKSNTLINMALSGVEQEFYWQHIDKDGNPVDAIVHLKKITINNSSYLLATVRDISEQLFYEKVKKTLDDKVNLLERAESMQNIVPGVIHDLNNAITTTMGLLDLINREEFLRDPMFIQLKNSMEKIRRFSDSIINIVNGRLERPQEVEINGLIDEIIRWLKPKQRENIKIMFNRTEKRIVISGYPLRIQQIVMNLLLNSIEAIGNRGGEIIIQTGRRFYSKAEISNNLASTNIVEDEYVYIVVEDNGCGMSKQTMSKLFEPFFTTKSYGKGLGMLSVKNAVEIHNGGIFVESVEQKGTRFEVILPRFK